MKRKNIRKGFTIVELVIVIAVIAILATVLVPTFGDVISRAQDSKAMQAAKNAYTEYIIEQNGTAAEYMVYELDGRFVALHNGAAVGVYESKEDALGAVVANGDLSLLADAGNGLWVYGGIPAVSNPDNIDLFVFAGQSNMMGAPALEPTVTDFTDKALEYKYMPKLRGQATGNFVSAQNPAGEWHYKDMTAAYGENLNDLSYKSDLNTYTANTYFCPAMSNPDRQAFDTQSEANTFTGPSLAPYFVTEYAEKYGHSSVYAHMAKGGVKITHYFTAEMNAAYNDLIDAYNAENGTSYGRLSAVSGAGTAFDDKYNSMLEDYAASYTDKTVKNKCFVWLQGESDDGLSYIEYKLKMEVLWDHLQELGFTHFFVLRVGYWGDEGILNVMKAQEDFCAENENCYIVTRAPSLVPYRGLTTENWWINEPSEEYQNCRDRFVNGAGNDHFNEKAFQLFAERSAENIHRVLHQGLDPILEEENIKGMTGEIEEPYKSYIGTEAFKNPKQYIVMYDKDTDTWGETTNSGYSTDLIAVSSTDSVWISNLFAQKQTFAVGGFYDADGNLVAPLWYEDFGYSAVGGSGSAAYVHPDETNRVSVAYIEAKYGVKVAYVRFAAWGSATDNKDGHKTTEARIYSDIDTDYSSYIGTETFKNAKQYIVMYDSATDTWGETTKSGYSTDLIAISSTDSVWISELFAQKKNFAVGGFYDADGNLVAPLWYEDFGYSAVGGSGAAAYVQPTETNRVSVAYIEAKYNVKVAYVRFAAWTTSASGVASTEARIYHGEASN